MERDGDIIYFDESEQQSGPPLLASVHASQAPRVLDMICSFKDTYGFKLQEMALTEAYDDQAALFLANAKTQLIMKHRKLELMADELVEVAGAEIIGDSLVLPE